MRTLLRVLWAMNAHGAAEGLGAGARQATGIGCAGYYLTPRAGAPGLAEM